MAQLSEQCKRGEHTWIATTAANFRMCGESGCHVTQRLQDGTWIEMQPVKGAKGKKNKIAASTLCEQTGEHAWIATTAANYQKCQRVGCTAVVRFTGGGYGLKQKERSRHNAMSPTRNKKP